MICIDANKLMLKPVGDGTYLVTKKAIENAKTFEAEPVHHGHWISAGHDEGSLYRKCSVCNTMFANIGKTKYCSECGAKMDECGDEEA